MSDSTLLSIVIPCYNEQESLREMHKRTTAAASAAPVRDYEIILINDGSSDNTLQIMRDILTTDPHLVIVNLARNHGHQLALTAGLFQAKGDYILILDADLQDPPELMNAMLERARSGVDVVYGQRTQREGETWFKKITATCFYRFLSYLSDVPIPRDAGDFRMISHRVLEQFKAMPEQQRFIRGMIAWVGFRQEAFPYKRAARFDGVTKYPFIKMVQFAIDAVSSFSIKPLRISLFFALMGAALAGLLGLYALYAYFEHETIAGWTSLAALITFFSSLQLFCIGMIGEYLGRTYMEVKRRPLFIIQDIIRSGDRS